MTILVCDTDFLSSFLKICRHFKKSILLISDNKARRVANKNAIFMLNISAFLLACKDKEILSRDDLLMIIHDLKDKDYYEFSEEEKNRLVNISPNPTLFASRIPKR